MRNTSGPRLQVVFSGCVCDARRIHRFAFASVSRERGRRQHPSRRAASWISRRVRRRDDDHEDSRQLNEWAPDRTRATVAMRGPEPQPQPVDNPNAVMGRRSMSDSPWAGRGRQHSACCTCDPDTLETPWKSELCAILHARDPAQASGLLDQFVQQEEASIRRVLARVRRVVRLSSDDGGVALSYLGQALMKMVHQRWRAKDGPGTSAVFDDSRNLPAILEAETRNCLRDDRRNGLMD